MVGVVCDSSRSGSSDASKCSSTRNPSRPTPGRRGGGFRPVARARSRPPLRARRFSRRWPQLGTDAAASNLHKAASYGRRAIGDRGAIVRSRWHGRARPARRRDHQRRALEAGDDFGYGGALPPDELYEQWTLRPRARLRERRLALLRSEGRLDDVLREDQPTRRPTARSCAEHVASGDRPAARASFRLLRDELARLGAGPPGDLALQRELTRGRAVVRSGFSTPPSRDVGSSSRARRRPLRVRSRRWRRAARHGSPGSARRAWSRQVLAEAEARVSHAARRGPRGGVAARRTHRSWSVRTRSPRGAGLPARSPIATRPPGATAASVPASGPRRKGSGHADRLVSAVAQLLVQAAR